MKKILIINGHPNTESFNHSLAAAYLQGAQDSNAEVAVINIAALDFDPNLRFGYRKRTSLEPDLERAIAMLKAAEHLVWFFPTWWASYPAIMKGFIDRTFLPGITFETQQKSPFPKPLLKGKSARVIITSDTPKWYDFLYMKRPVRHQFNKGVLAFCGVSPIKTTYISVIKNSNEKQRASWLDQVYALGKKQL